jgi:hypothetical protein
MQHLEVSGAVVLYIGRTVSKGMETVVGSRNLHMEVNVGPFQKRWKYAPNL